MATRTELQELIDTIATGQPNTAVKLREVFNAIADSSFQTGDIKELNCSNEYISANFDEDGLGIVDGERYGWAICNGNNGTINRTGRIGIGYGMGYGDMGTLGGSANHQLTINELPPHTHDISIGTTGTSATPSVKGDLDNDTIIGTKTTSSVGNASAFSIMQPYVVSLFIQKL